MLFFQDTLWWLLALSALVTATIPSFIRPFRAVPCMMIALAWTAAVACIWIRFDPGATITAVLLSAGSGALTFLLTIFFSGLSLMAKKRYR